MDKLIRNKIIFYYCAISANFFACALLYINCVIICILTVSGKCKWKFFKDTDVEKSECKNI